MDVGRQIFGQRDCVEGMEKWLLAGVGFGRAMGRGTVGSLMLKGALVAGGIRDGSGPWLPYLTSSGVDGACLAG